jgi:signal transduction histidine kinase
MNSRRPTPWPAFAAVPLIVMLVLGWLLLGYSGSRSGAQALPGHSGVSVEYLDDSQETLTLSQVETLRAGDWTAWPGENVAVSGRTRALWVRVRLHNPSPTTSLEGILENDDYFADQVEFWIKEPTSPPGTFISSELAGEGVPATGKKFRGREAAFSLAIPASSSRVVYVRLENYFNPYARLIWWPDANAFHEARLRNGLAEGVYLGGILALLGYNVMLWLRLRQPDIGWYVTYLGSMVGFMILARAILPAVGVPLASPYLEKALGLMIALVGGSLTQFARVFLEVRTSFPGTSSWMKRWGALLVLIAVVSLFVPWSHASWLPLVVVCIGLTHVLLLAVAFCMWRTRRRQVRFFLLSFGCLFAGSLPMVAVWFVDSMYRDVGMRGVMIGSALEMLLLSLAVADRFARAQESLVEETEQRRMIEETYADELEEEVRERTRELQAANADKDRMLSVIGHDLRGPLTGLMRSAEGANGDFPQDAARTSRALLLMIEDLVLWARLKAGRPAVAVHPVQSLMVPAVALHQSLAEQADLNLVQEGADELWVETDLVLTQTLVRNLVANALKFARSRVVLSVEETTNGVRVIVGNDGPALAPEVAARLAANADEPVTATSGMGLRLCREICRALGLQLVATAGAEGGTEFSFALKKAASAAVAVEEKP